jgi:hypothetical protein
LAPPIEVEGAKLDPSVQVGTTTLQLKGAGVRTRALFKVYVAGLQVPQRAGDAATLLAQTGPRRVTLVMLRHIDAAIPGDDFFTSVLRIWIGDKPVDGKLKMGLLSGAAGQKPL